MLVRRGRHRRHRAVTVEPGGLRQPEVSREGQPGVFRERQPEAFRKEIHAAVRYERGLVVKALGVLAVLAVIVVLRTLYFA